MAEPMDRRFIRNLLSGHRTRQKYSPVSPVNGSASGIDCGTGRIDSADQRGAAAAWMRAVGFETIAANGQHEIPFASLSAVESKNRFMYSLRHNGTASSK